jgi:hypothetical protein
MRIIPTRIHGMLDYGSGLLLLLAPYIFNFADGTAAQYVPQAIGAGVLLMSLVTDYELSLAKLVPMPAHLAVDVAGGVLLRPRPGCSASPIVFTGLTPFSAWPRSAPG